MRDARDGSRRAGWDYFGAGLRSCAREETGRVLGSRGHFPRKVRRQVPQPSQRAHRSRADPLPGNNGCAGSFDGDKYKLFKKMIQN